MATSYISNNNKKLAASMAVAVLAVPMVMLGAVMASDASATPQCNKYAKTIEEAICMQDMNDDVKESMVEDEQYQLKDKRDNKVYYVSRLQDGNVWMTQNLDLDLDSNVTYTSEDTDLPEGATWEPERSTYTADQTEWGLEEVISYEITNYNGYIHPESYDPGNYYWNGVFSDQGDWNNYYASCSSGSSDCDETLYPIATYTTITGTPVSQYHLGNYYNWTAAVAMNDSSDYGVWNEQTGEYVNTETNQSICPAGWTLPKSSYIVESPENGSTQYLLESYGWDGDSWMLPNDSKAWNAPLYLPLSGGWNGAFDLVGSYGDFWSSVLSDYDARVFTFGAVVEGVISPAYPFDSISGLPVRCLARSRAAVEAEEIEDEDISWTENQTYEQGSEEEAVLRIDAPLDEFLSVTVDDTLLTENVEYTLTSGSTIITFAPVYLETLSEGEHQVEIAYQGNRTVNTKLTVTKAPTENPEEDPTENPEDKPTDKPDNKPADKDEDVAVPNTGTSSSDEASYAKLATVVTAILVGIFTSVVSGIVLTRRNRK